MSVEYPALHKMIAEKAACIQQLRNELNILAARQFSPEGCPLGQNKYNHHFMSCILVGIGHWRWRCPFCGKEFRDE